MRHCGMLVLLFAFAATELVGSEIRVTVQEPSGVDRTLWPVTSGIPFAQGVLQDDQTTALYDSSSQEMPLQTEVLTRWPDGSVRWLLLDLQGDRFNNSVETAEVPKEHERMGGLPLDWPLPVRRSARRGRMICSHQYPSPSNRCSGPKA